jgi:putative transposase
VKQDHPDLSVRPQCRLLSLARSSLYYQPRGESAENLAFMKIIDRQFLETPWYGSRQMARHMQREGHRCGRHRVRRLMRLMRLVPIYQEPKTSKKHPEHKIYPYLLRGLAITRPNLVWCADISYSAPRPGWSGVHMTGMHGERRNGRLPCPLLQGGMSPSGGDLPSTGRVT